MKLTVAQFAIQPEVKTNRDKMLSILQSAQKGDWVIFAEGALSGYFPEEENYFEKLDRSVLERSMAEIADEVNRRECHCIYGTSTHDKNGMRNSVVIESHSEERQFYHKVELSALDRNHFVPGNRLPVFKLDGVSFGIQMCRELIFPKAWWSLKKKGAQVVFHVNNAIKEHDKLWRHISIARTVENAYFVCSVNNGASPQELSSHIVSPRGNVLSETQPSREQTLSTDINLSEVIDNLNKRTDY